MNSLLKVAPALAAVALVACTPDHQETMAGTLERDRVELVVESNEPILAIEVLDGQRVQVGDVILRQDPARHESRLRQQSALRDQAAARLAELRRGPRSEQIREARARLEANAALTENARTDLDREREIFERGLGDQAALDRVRARWENAVATEQASRESLEAMLQGTTVEELQQAEAAVAAAEARVDQAQLDLDRLTLRAPVNGTVDKVWFELGERPAPGTMVALVLDDARVYARIYVPEHRRAAMQPGMSVKVRLDGHEPLLAGTVSWVSADASFTPYFALTEHDRSRLSYLAEVEVPDAADLPSGLPLEVWPD